MPSLDERIAAARESVRRDPHRNLGPGHRRLVRAAVTAEGEASRRPRLLVPLDVLTARRVLPIWQREWKDDLPVRLIDAAERLREDAASATAAKRIAAAAWSSLEALGVDPRTRTVAYLDAVAAGMSAYCALNTALGEELTEDVDVTLGDSDLDVYEMDAGFWAAWAEADGPTWDRRSDPARRAAFWDWWLDQSATFASVGRGRP
jgi:immunity protein Imm5 of predicted polymorphic toxin system